ncbi:MAG: amino acid adenylation domain-containing protein, partial [Holosporaceae bacterium]|nr:amino acid adenylation domain-containing protein [Holosporaceae bacterium]
PEKFDADLFFEIKDRSIIVHTCDKLNEIGHRIVENIFGHLQTMVEGLLLDRSVPIKEIPLLTEREKKVFSDVYNNTKTEYPRDLSVSQIFEQQVELYPNNVAVKHLKESLTYDELNQKANQLASYLIDLGVKKGSLVATFFNKGVNSIMSILAITKAGATYTPIDPMYPREHIKYILQDTGALIVLSQEKDKYVLEECLPSGKFIIISVDSQSIKTRIFNNDNKENRNAVGSVRATDMAYIMYTSGSSGVPKGVCIPHRGIVRLIKNTNYIEVDSSDIVSQVASISFDASVFEVWTALLNGAALVCADNGVITDVDAFSEFLKQEKITVLTMVSALFEQHASADPSMFRRVKYLHVGGDVLNADAISKVMNCESGSPKFILNGYGPTENTNCTTVYSIPKDFDKTRPIPIGKPVSNTTVFVLDKFLNPVPECIPGELCTGGDGLFIGYLNKDELTGEKLISLKNGEKVYKSGDLVRWLPDGNIDYMCRLDTQAKIRGFRIELEAIELCLMNCHAVNQCAVVIKQDKNAKKTLVAYVVLKDKYKDAITVMKDFLRMYLPHYMIPNLFIIMESLPVTPNGKIDKKKLLQNFQEQSQKSVDYVLPRNKLESDLAEIWKELLGLSSVSINDNFFDLGGYSLLLTEMAVKIKKQLDIAFPLHLFLESPTLINLARIIESKKMNSQSTFRDVKSTFFHDIFLDPRISYLPDSPFPTEQKTIFITGATGFLGIHLLNDVYRMSDAKIYCLVRGKDVEEAEEKLRRSANKYHLNKAVVADKNRVIAVPGDLSKPNLGISPDTYEMLCETADCILHCGAQVHHLYNYEMLRADNVAGTLEIMAIASRGKNKHVHFVSTLSAVVGSSSDKIIEDFPSENDFVPGEMSGYAQTKLASEIILGKALKRDMSVFVYRPTWIIGNNDSGAFASENNHLFLLLKGCLQLGSAPILDAKLNLISVDVVSSFIVKTALDSSNKKRVFNMINPHDTEWNDVIDRLNGCGYEIEPVSPLIWQKEYLPAVDEWNALYPLMPLYFDGGVEWASMQNIPCQRDGGDAILDHGSLELSPEKVMSNVIRICSVFFGRQGFA